MKNRVVCFGEIMLRLAPPGHSRFVQADSFAASYGGGEANVAISLAQLGLASSYVSKIPDNTIGQAAVNHLRRFGVETSAIVRGGDRLGIYFLETGAAQRPSKVIYDRANSAISTAEPGEFAWEYIFKDAKWFHWTGITAAISDKAANCVAAACKVAKKLGLTISCDLNYRKKLWPKEKAQQVMSNLMQYVDVCIGNEEDAADIFAIHADNSNIVAGKINSKGYQSVASQLRERFALKYVAITLRESLSASRNGWSALLYTNNNYYQSEHYDIFPIIDRVGGGDSFAAGLIYSLLTEKEPQEAINFASAASCLKHTIPGDSNLITLDEIATLAAGNASGRVER